MLDGWIDRFPPGLTELFHHFGIHFSVTGMSRTTTNETTAQTRRIRILLLITVAIVTPNTIFGITFIIEEIRHLLPTP